ncbi:MAG: tRNA dihydrouridine synthase DusB [Clostridia bacterium]|nr:tRNA dihydrouridine synthase DusB [Clostridia bacterium]
MITELIKAETLLVNIGKITLPGRVLLAPMAGVTDSAFRQICLEQGAALTYSEMVSAKGLIYHDRKSAELLQPAPNEQVFAIQLFGSEPDILRQAVPEALEISGAAILDLNMGCPMPKIVNNGEGSALMKRPELAAELVRACVEAAGDFDVPVTVKCRIGWESETVVEFAQAIEEADAAALCVHGRTRSQMYAGKADWDAIARVRQAVKLPLIANGDVSEPEDAVRILEATGADACMVGRASFGNPWIFARAEAALRGEEIPALPDIHGRMAVARRHIGLAVERKGEKIALLEARHHLAWYTKGLRGAAAFRARISSMSSWAEFERLLDELTRAYGA